MTLNISLSAQTASASTLQPSSTASTIKSSPQDTNCNGSGGGESNEWFTGCLPHLEDTEGDDLSSCLLSLTAANSAVEEAVGGGCSTSGSTDTDQLTLALIRRQRELRLVCAANHNILHRLIQAARRDLQRQEIQRRLAIADADVSDRGTLPSHQTSLLYVILSWTCFIRLGFSEPRLRFVKVHN